MTNEAEANFNRSNALKTDGNCGQTTSGGYATILLASFQSLNSLQKGQIVKSQPHHYAISPD